MRDTSFYVASLLELASASAADRRVLWRQAMAALSRANADDGPGPLEGIHPDVLVKGVSAALAAGLADDLDWLSPSAAGVALYTLAAALPVGTEQRELGRRVLARMLAGNAETFAAIATSMAQSGGKGLASQNVRSRIAIVTELPLAHGIADGPLAHALLSRREFQRDWVLLPSTRSLPARRLAAKILERAAREAARRAQMGDMHGMRPFMSETVRAAYTRLLDDRESLVWRYVAVARGLIAGWIPQLRQEILDGLKEGLSPTEWRRAAASLAAYAAVRPDEALKVMQGVVKRGLFTWEDPASASAFVWGVPRAIEAEPEVAGKMLDLLMGVATHDVAEAVLELRYEYGASKVVDRVTAQARELLEAAQEKRRTITAARDDGADALYREIGRDLESAARDDEPVRSLAAAALDAFVTEGAPGAYARAREVLVAAQGGMDALEAVAKDDHAEGRAGAMARRTSMAVMRDLDTSLLERPVIGDLLRLGSAADARASETALDTIRERFAGWIVACESPEQIADEGSAPRHATLRLRRLRALLHLVDGDLGEMQEPAPAPNARRVEDSEVRAVPAENERARRLRALWLRTVRSLLDHFQTDPAPMLKRTLLAGLARALDALVRLVVCDVADALLVLALRIRGRRDFETLAEASMDPDLRHVLARYAKYLRDSEPTLAVSSEEGGPDSMRPSRKPENRRLEALCELANELAPEGSARSEALQRVLVRIHGALTTTASVGSLSALSTTSTSDADVVASVETWVGALAQMCAGARARLDPEVSSMAPPSPNPSLLSVHVSRVLAEAETTLLEDQLGAAIDEMVAGIPHGIGRLVSGILWGLADLPVERPSAEAGIVAVTDQLPAWLPARRTIGGFYVQRALGIGGTASVFVVVRSEEKGDPNAERLALKVPDYNATAARVMSQDEFLKMFREEASALILLPSHTNLARFVTFDMGTKPLPILVMELVEGVTLERVIHGRTLDMRQCLKILDDVLAGLEAMHSVGLGHLDIKPSNVLLRRGEQGVLVDFGLAGRKLRQGCGTGPYGAPEVWGVLPPGYVASPAHADIYSFACVAFEMLMGRLLFDAPNEVAQVSLHLAHDGFPAAVKALLANPEIAPLAEVLQPALRRDPRLRPTAEDLRRDLRSVWSMVEDAAWPAALALSPTG
ncbi:MAG: serine/threonine protein kinase [Labilithrix sp.]|nr:serine/threonine protein kinase [Labilithrix sp.]MCW5813876.1 serine/threonine protein kinase [Labilithrix sp.]